MDRYKLVFTEEQLNILLICLDGELKRSGLNALNGIVDLYNLVLGKQLVEDKVGDKKEKKEEA